MLGVRDGGVLHSSPLSINSLAGQLISASTMDCELGSWVRVALDMLIDRHADTL